MRSYSLACIALVFGLVAVPTALADPMADAMAQEEDAKVTVLLMVNGVTQPVLGWCVGVSQTPPFLDIYDC